MKRVQHPKWERFSERTIDFRTHVYNRNVYKPKTALVTRRFEVGQNDMQKNIGRGDQYTGDLYVAQAGAACHLDLLDCE